ncbi:bifunctional diguanylate cyclase/phosphodiesterase [Planococcus sp. 107-1]|uniref:putative bifunctional diguanylate cyclase/phosphodiesterase n=1 Tax=Planococcus sp. 107-1 TaxID=2908840 RepID=UPI001F3929DF|nr:EAL domain-containing protein [Planococcus sp. 107-1]UJF25630.1 EAL domain-containing protein [Planococcus sp. 107-1]
MILVEQAFIKNSAISISKFPQDLPEKVFTKVSEGIMVTDLHKRIVHVNPAFELVTGYEREEVLGKTPKVLQSGIHRQDFYQTMWEKMNLDGEWSGEIWNRRKNGEIYPEWLNITAIKDENGIVRNYCGIFSDLTDRKTSEDELKKMALTDSLTGTSNRYDFTERMQQLIKTSQKYELSHAILFLDLDRFKQINDSLGHDIGDLLLMSVAERIRGLLKNKDILARYGGDEFVVALTAIKHPAEAANMAEKIIEVLETPFHLADEEIYISTSIGISLYPIDGMTLDDMLRKADKAMYYAKQNGRNQYCFYFDDLKTASRRLVLMEAELRKAIENRTFMMHYQPKVDIQTKRVTGFESLIRWESEKLGVVAPSEFIPFAEETGLIISLSEAIIETVCRDFIAMNFNDSLNVPISINISSLHFQQPNFVASIKMIFEKMNCQPSFFELELTEHTIMDNVAETTVKLQELRDLGFSIAVDDFGTGYSSLSYLSRFPIDQLKVDSSFVKEIVSIKENEFIVDAIINLAHSLRLTVVAEGVETPEQVELLTELGCDMIQGYVYSKAMAAEELLAFIEIWNIKQQERASI